MHFQIYAPAQLFLFLQAIFFGIGLGIFYDVFRILRIAVKDNSIIIFFEDLLFFISASIFTFLFIFSVNSGQLRWFIFLGLILGFVVYYFTLGKLVLKISQVIIKAVKTIFKFLFSLFIKPFVIIFRWFYKKINPVCTNVKNKSKIVHNNVKNRLKNRRNMLYNLFKRNMQKLRNKKGHNKKAVQIDAKEQRKKQRKKI